MRLTTTDRKVLLLSGGGVHARRARRWRLCRERLGYSRRRLSLLWHTQQSTSRHWFWCLKMPSKLSHRLALIALSIKYHVSRCTSAHFDRSSTLRSYPLHLHWLERGLCKTSRTWTTTDPAEFQTFKLTNHFVKTVTIKKVKTVAVYIFYWTVYRCQHTDITNRWLMWIKTIDIIVLFLAVKQTNSTSQSSN